MKKIISLICAIILTLSINAQTGFKDAVDFNCTDEYGTNVHLFDILDDGQYALLYFFCILQVTFRAPVCAVWRKSHSTGAAPTR